MKNTFGNSVSVTLFGESHGEAVGAVLDGMAPGIPFDDTFLAAQMRKRRSLPAISTARAEADEVCILSGIYGGKTTGTPITFLIKNTDADSAAYKDIATVARPGHADYPAFMKYHGSADPRGGGHFSGRITAGLVAAGAVALTALSRCGIRIGTHIAECGGIADRAFADYQKDIALLSDMEFGALDTQKSADMIRAIEKAKSEGDSVGGILETAVIGLPAGVGEPWFDSLESVLSHILFSVPGIKGVEFGDGFALSRMRGSMANDAYRLRGSTVETETNRCGGILGGLSDGMPLLFRVAVKPTPSVSVKQETVDFVSGKAVSLTVGGRHDPAIVHRARVVVDSVAALALCDMLALRYGTDFLAGNKSGTEVIPC